MSNLLREWRVGDAVEDTVEDIAEDIAEDTVEDTVEDTAEDTVEEEELPHVSDWVRVEFQEWVPDYRVFLPRFNYILTKILTK